MLGVAETLGWSFPLLRLRTFDLRVSWILPVWMAFDAIRFAQLQLGGMMPFAVIVPPLTMLVHVLGHHLGARLAGGTLDGSILSAINNQDRIQVPLRPWSHLFAGLGGPLANLLVVTGCCGALAWRGQPYAISPFGFAPDPLGYIASQSLLVVAFNILACQPFDGHRWWRGLLWLFMPMASAVRVALTLGFISAILLIVAAAWMTSFLFLFFGICSLLATIGDRQQIAAGHDPVFLADPAYAGSARPSAWSRRREERRRERLEQELNEEQEILDRLLAKVSAQGLPALNNAERKQLQRISQRQKERQRA